jgi:Leucine-rich repeat (LRR) protein
MEIVISIVAKIGEYLVEPIGQQFGYLIHLNSNIQNLKDQSRKLSDKREGLQLLIDAEKRNGLEILPEVERWVQKVDNISQGLQRFIDIEDRMCLNLKSRYSLSKKAKKKTLEIDGLLKEAEQTFFNKVSYSPRPQGVVSTEVFKTFESRESIMEEVLEALRDDKISMISICGMGGIGKTTMAKEVAKRAKDDELFDEVVMALVSQNQDLRKIQGQIADLLGLKLERETELGRANELYSRLMRSKSVLVILDDVWEALNLEDIGIPYGGQHKRRKILLTSRSEEACNQMRSQIFPIKVLSEEEAWNLFREMAGDCVDTLGLHPIAKEVAKECGALPVAIVTVARALENKTKDEWIAAREQLKKSIPKNIPRLHSKVYSSIEFSYSYLKSDEAKSCFSLCCLFPEEFDIPIEYLVRYGVGRRLFAKIDNVAEARSRVHAMVNDLKRSFLLLDSRNKECVKMNDVVRDVAISIAEEHGFLVRCDDKMEEWPEKDIYEIYVAISLFSREMKKHPNGLECSKLEHLQLSCSKDTQQMLPANMFQEMKELKVLSMRGMSFPSLPQSIQVLQNLRTLHLEYCGLEDVSAIGALGKLEMLSFLGSEIKELPREIGNLGNLKLLDLSECSTLQRIPYGLLSSLYRLEEFYMLGVDVNWEPTSNFEGANASLAELIPLTHLMALKLYISNSNAKLLPKDLHFKNQMIKFQIKGRTHRWDFVQRTPHYLLQNELTLEDVDAVDIKESRWLCQLLEKSEILKLINIEVLKSILYEDLPCLKVLTVVGSEDVEYVIDATSDQTPRDAFPILESLTLVALSNLKEIYHGQFLERSFSGAQLACFGNLTSLHLVGCHCLKNVFSLSIARGLVQLQELYITSCTDMEEIFSKEGQDEKASDMIKFLQLKHVELSDVPRLIGFCTFVDPIELVQPSHAKGTQPILHQEVCQRLIVLCFQIGLSIFILFYFFNFSSSGVD